MTKVLECPICEFPITSTGSEGEEICCPRCGQTFHRLAGFELISEGQQQVESQPPSASSGPSPSVIEVPEDNVSRHSSSFPSTSVEIQQSFKAKRSRSSKELLFFLFLCVVVIFLSAFALRFARIGSESTETSRQADETPGSASQFPEDNAGTEAAREQVDEPKLRPIEHASFRFHSKTDAERLWNSAYLSVFELDITRNGRHEMALGTLIDTRGWLVTSHAAIKDAESVVVRNVSGNPVSDISSKALSDQARGILATAPELDLALLQINRRLVTMIRPLTMLEKTPVEGVFGLAANHPGTHPEVDRKAWVVECRTDRGGKLDSLKMDLRKSAETLNLSGDVDWLVETFSVHPIPGAGVFSVDGSLIGITTSAMADDSAIVAPGSMMKQLLASAASEPTPFQAAVSPQDDPPTIEVADGVPQVTKGEDGFELSREVNVLASACEAIEWTPVNRADVETLRSYFSVANRVAAALDEEQMSFRSLDTLEAQIEHWDQQLARALMNPLKDSIKVLHQYTLPVTEYDSDRATLVAVEVIQRAVLGGKTIYVKVIDENQFFRIEADPERYVMREGERWMLELTQIKQNKIRAKLPPGGRYETISCNAAEVRHCVNMSKLTR